MRNVLVIGATGFTGKRVLHELAQTNLKVSCLVRSTSTPPQGVSTIKGDLNDLASIKNALDGQDALIYVASLGFGHAQDVISACKQANVKRAIFISTTAIFTQLNAPSKKVRLAAEETIQSSQLEWTILRPTMIYGRKGDRNMERLVKLLKKCPVLFTPGGGNALQQPIFVDDVAKATVAAIQSPKTIHKAYNISGAQPLSFRQVVQTTAKTLNKKAYIIPLPLGPCRFVLRLYEKLSHNPKLKEEQLLRLNENKAFDHTQATKDFGFNPRSFEAGIKNLVQELDG